MADDRKLITAIKHGGREGLRQVYERYRTDMLSLAVSLVGDISIAEDIVHDVFVAFAKRAGSLKLRTSLKSYLMTSIANQSRNYYRKKRTVNLEEIEVSERDNTRPESDMEQVEFARQIETAMEMLPDEQREVLALHLQSGLTFKATSKNSF